MGGDGPPNRKRGKGYGRHNAENSVAVENLVSKVFTASKAIDEIAEDIPRVFSAGGESCSVGSVGVVETHANCPKHAKQTGEEGSQPGKGRSFRRAGDWDQNDRSVDRMDLQRCLPEPSSEGGHSVEPTGE
ncbi:MAG: hypothetical protein CMJ47_10925 [Planctomyces sp.]|nr:hypothetical protein [Planctomyces sp.]